MSFWKLSAKACLEALKGSPASARRCEGEGGRRRGERGEGRGRGERGEGRGERGRTYYPFPNLHYRTGTQHRTPLSPGRSMSI